MCSTSASEVNVVAWPGVANAGRGDQPRKPQAGRAWACAPQPGADSDRAKGGNMPPPTACLTHNALLIDVNVRIKFTTRCSRMRPRRFADALAPGRPGAAAHGPKGRSFALFQTCAREGTIDSIPCPGALNMVSRLGNQQPVIGTSKQFDSNSPWSARAKLTGLREQAHG